jgi:putative SOS response-associated peptidase YedK
MILHQRDYERWLAPTDPAHFPVDLLRPFPAEEMKAWKVGRAVGNTRNNDPSLEMRRSSRFSRLVQAEVGN